jgi:hypothetical protein
MDEGVWADRFNRDVEVLLKEAGRTDLEPLPGGYGDTVDLARVLATTDFSANSEIRQSLRRRLVSDMYREDSRSARGRATGRAMPALLRGQRALAGATAVLVGILLLTASWLGSFKSGILGAQVSWRWLLPREQLVVTQMGGSEASAAVSMSVAPRLAAISESAALMRTVPAIPASRQATPVVSQRSQSVPSSAPPTPPRLTSSQMSVPLCTIPAPQWDG